MKTKEKQQYYKPKILDLLKENNKGLVVAKIKEKLNTDLSRNTIMSYLEEMEKEGKVSKLKVGRYRLWIHKKFEQNEKPEIETRSNVIFDFFEEFLNQLNTNHISHIDSINWVKVGNEMAKNFLFSEYFSKDLKQDYDVLRNHEDVDMQELFLQLYAPILKVVLNWMGDTEALVDPPILNISPNQAIVRIRNTKYADKEVFYKLFCGIEQVELPQLFVFIESVEIHSVYKNERIIDLVYTFKNK